MMRISDLLASEVRHADGTPVGRVREVRVVQDGPAVSGVQAAFRVDALIVGRGSLGVRLGYHAGHVRGPWLLNVIFGGTAHRVKEIAMDDVAILPLYYGSARLLVKPYLHGWQRNLMSFLPHTKTRVDLAVNERK